MRKRKIFFFGSSELLLFEVSHSAFTSCKNYQVSGFCLIFAFRMLSLASFFVWRPSLIPSTRIGSLYSSQYSASQKPIFTLAHFHSRLVILKSSPIQSINMLPSNQPMLLEMAGGQDSIEDSERSKSFPLTNCLAINLPTCLLKEP